MKEPLPDADLRPTHTPLGVDPKGQAKALKQLRKLENRGREARFERDDLIVANALSHSLSRPDMARAIDVSTSRIDQIISSHYRLLQNQRNAGLLERAGRHLPQS